MTILFVLLMLLTYVVFTVSCLTDAHNKVMHSRFISKLCQHTGEWFGIFFVIPATLWGAFSFFFAPFAVYDIWDEMRKIDGGCFPSLSWLCMLTVGAFFFSFGTIFYCMGKQKMDAVIAKKNVIIEEQSEYISQVEKILSDERARRVTREGNETIN